MTNIDEVRISCQKGNLKTTPSMSVYFLSLFQSKLGEFFYCRQVARFLLFFQTYESKFEFWKNPKKYWNWNQTHWWAFSPCIRITIKYTVSTSQSTCFVETFSSRVLFPYLGTEHYFSRGDYKKFSSGNIFINMLQTIFPIFFSVLFMCAQYHYCLI